MMEWTGLNLQNILSMNNYSMDTFHDLVLLLLLLILTIVLIMFISLLSNNLLSMVTMENTTLEAVWTVLPGLVLIMLGVPSLHTLYMTEAQMPISNLIFKVVGHQWYWSYELNNILDFNSYMIPSSELNNNDMRLLEVDNKMVLPMGLSIRTILSSTDVIHSWSVPSMGIKMDCIPGRLNQVVIDLPTPGLFYGQCSEICGNNHSFMPISLEITSFSLFKKWVDTMIGLQ